MSAVETLLFDSPDRFLAEADAFLKAGDRQAALQALCRAWEAVTPQAGFRETPPAAAPDAVVERRVSYRKG